MEKYVTNIKDLVIQALTNGSEIKAKAESGDALSCFQMGMVHLLGIKTPIDFKKASVFFENQSLADDPDACRLLGFIGECEGNYSMAFKNYAKAAEATGNESKLPYLNKVFEQRSNLQGFFKSLVLPTKVLNNEITTILNDFIKGGESKNEASYKLVAICDDASILGDDEQFPQETPFELPDVLEVIDIKGNSLLDDSKLPTPISEIMYNCDAAAAECKNKWMEEVPILIEKIGKRLDEEEKERIKKQQEEEAARLKKQQEEKRRAYLQEEAEREFDRKIKKLNRLPILIPAIILSPIALIIIILIFSDMLEKKDVATSISAGIFVFAIFVVLPFFIIKWIVSKYTNRKRKKLIEIHLNSK